MYLGFPKNINRLWCIHSILDEYKKSKVENEEFEWQLPPDVL